MGVSSSGEGLAELRARPYSIVLCDAANQDLSYADLVQRVQQSREDALLIVLIPAGQAEVAVEALKAGVYDYITKPLNLELLSFTIQRAVERYRLQTENRDYQQNLESRVQERRREVSLTLRNAIEALVHALEAKDEYSEGHARRTAEEAVLLGKRLDLSDDALEQLRLAALLQDIGYIGIKEGITSKPGRLTPQEYEHVKTHPIIATRILEPIDELRGLIPIVRHHHERYDGRGYPDGLSGEDIPYGARILSLADVYDALISPRPYRSAFSPEMALAIIEGNAEAQFDPELTRIYVELKRERLRRQRDS